MYDRLTFLALHIPPLSTTTAESTYSGPGAGRYPTANSVVNDIVRLARLGAVGTPTPFPLEQSWELQSDFETQFYVRITGVVGNTESGVPQHLKHSVDDLAEKAGVVVKMIQRAPGDVGTDAVSGGVAAEFAILIEPCKLSKVAVFMESVKTQKWSTEDPVLLSILAGSEFHMHEDALAIV